MNRGNLGEVRRKRASTLGAANVRMVGQLLKRSRGRFLLGEAVGRPEPHKLLVDTLLEVRYVNRVHLCRKRFLGRANKRLTRAPAQPSLLSRAQPVQRDKREDCGD